MSAAQQDAKAILAQSQKRHLTYKHPITVKLDERIVLHLNDRGVGLSRAIDLLLRKLLTDDGVDLTKPHPKETYAKNEDGTSFTYQEHWDQGGDEAHP